MVPSNDEAASLRLRLIARDGHALCDSGYAAKFEEAAAVPERELARDPELLSGTASRSHRRRSRARRPTGRSARPLEVQAPPAFTAHYAVEAEDDEAVRGLLSGELFELLARTKSENWWIEGKGPWLAIKHKRRHAVEHKNHVSPAELPRHHESVLRIYRSLVR